MTHQPTTSADVLGAPPAGFVAVAAPRDVLRRVRRWLLVTGILALVGGIVAIVVPAVASVGTTIFVGWLLVFAGAVMGSHAWSLRAGGRPFAADAANAVLALLAGLAMIVFPLTGTLTLTVLLAAWFLASGALHLLAAWRGRGRPGAVLQGAGGALSLLIGLLVAVELPSSAAWAIGLLVGVNLIFWGIRALVAASLVKAALERG